MRTLDAIHYFIAEILETRMGTTHLQWYKSFLGCPCIFLRAVDLQAFEVEATSSGIPFCGLFGLVHLKAVTSPVGAHTWRELVANCEGQLQTIGRRKLAWLSYPNYRLQMEKFSRCRWYIIWCLLCLFVGISESRQKPLQIMAHIQYLLLRGFCSFSLIFKKSCITIPTKTNE